MRRRPWGIWVVVGLQVALAITLLPGVAETFPGVSPVGGMPMSELWRDVYIAWAVLNVLAGLWMWTLSRRGWALVMVMVGTGLIGNLFLWAINDPNWIRMGIQALTAFYLNSAPVRTLFQRDHQVDTIILRDREADAA